jgi:hypothetical protein
MQSRKIIFKIVLLFLIPFIFVGCGGSTPSVSKKEVSVVKKQRPSWVDGALPNDTQRYMYGLGIESDRQKAIKAALSDMVSKLGTTIESNYESNDVVINNSYTNSTVKNQIKTEVSKIKINNYKVVKSYKVSYREFAVLVETDKLKLVNGLKDTLKQHKRELEQKSKAIKNSDILTRYNKKKELAKEAKSMIAEIFIISELDTKFDKQKELDYITKKEDEALEEEENLKFYVRGTKKSEKFVGKIKNYLAQNGYVVTNSKKDAVNVVLSIKDYIKGSIAVLTLDVKVIEKNNRIGGKSIVMKERYNGSKQSVYKNAAIHFEQDMNTMGINELIGLNLNKD